jgi:hypothetical protein
MTRIRLDGEGGDVRREVAMKIILEWAGGGVGDKDIEE